MEMNNVNYEKRPFRAYDGDSPYIFVSYSHKDKSLVYPIIEQLYLKGYNIWYDQGIESSERLREKINRKICFCSVFLLFYSYNAEHSRYVMEEEIPAAWNASLNDAFAKKCVCVVLDSEPNVQLTKVRGFELIDDYYGSNGIIQLLGLLSDECRDCEERMAGNIYLEPQIGRVFFEDKISDFEFEIEDGKCVVSNYTGTNSLVIIPSINGQFRVEKIGERAFYGNNSIEKIVLSPYTKEIAPFAFANCQNLTTASIPSSVSLIDTTSFQNSPNIIFICENGTAAYNFANENNISISGEIQEKGLVIEQTISETNYAYICYAEQDEVILRPLLDILQEKGCVLYRIESRQQGDFFKDVINYSDIIANANVFLCFLSKSACASQRVKTEQLFARVRKGNNYFVAIDDVNVQLFWPELSDVFIRTISDFNNNILNEDFVSEIFHDLEKNQCNLVQIINDDIFSYKVIKGTVTITGVRNPSNEIVVPSNLPSIHFDVEKIGDSFCEGIDVIHSVIISDTITEIQEQAFHSCNCLEEIKLSAALKKIGIRAFSDCYNLLNIVFPEEIILISDEAFSSCSSLQTLFIPQKVERIGAYAFSKCINLSEVILQCAITQIPPYCFSDCSSLKTIQLPNTLVKISAYAFKNCTGIESLIIPNSLRLIDDTSFEGCQNIRFIFPNDAHPLIQYAQEHNISFECADDIKNDKTQSSNQKKSRFDFIKKLLSLKKE